MQDRGRIAHIGRFLYGSRDNARLGLACGNNHGAGIGTGGDGAEANGNDQPLARHLHAAKIGCGRSLRLVVDLSQPRGREVV